MADIFSPDQQSPFGGIPPYQTASGPGPAQPVQGNGVRPGDPGTYIGRDGNWYDENGNSLGPSGQAPTPTEATHGGSPNSAGQPGVGQPVVQTPPATGGSLGGPIAPFSGVTYPQFSPPPLPASLQKQFTLPTAQDLITNDPGYQERFDMGRQAIERGAAAQGSILSGGTQKALTQYGQNYASGEYNNYVQQQLAQRQQQASDYLGLAYGPAWQQNQGAVNQYGQLYSQYQDLINNNRNAQNDYINALLQEQQIGVGAARAGQAPASSGG